MAGLNVKIHKLDKVVKDTARHQVGSVPSTKVVPHKNKKASKHPKREMEQERQETT